jgi:hypothetical protein
MEAAIRRLATAAIATSVILLASTVAAVAFPWIGEAFHSSPASGSYVTGQRIDVPSDLYRGREMTLLLFARSSCGACEAARPAFTALTTAAAARQLRVRLILQAENSAESADSRLIAGLGLSSEHVRRLAFEGLRLERVPAVALVEGDGTIVKFVEGIPEGRTLSRLLDALRELPEPATTVARR